MNGTLSSNDWKKINDIILEMNSKSNIIEALSTFLLGINRVVPYEKASIYFYAVTKDKFCVDTRIGQGFDEKDLKIYDEYYYQIDDIVEKMQPNKLVAVRSSDIFNLQERKETEYYNDYIRPVRTHYSLDTNFRWNRFCKGANFGSLDLFRTLNDGDFSEKELEICKILQPHLEIKAAQYGFSLADVYDDILDKFLFTKCENTIARLLLQGYTNEQIANEQFITVSTVKKHVAAILEKSKSNSRVEFLCKINSNSYFNK